MSLIKLPSELPRNRPSNYCILVGGCMKARDENRELLDGAVKRLMAYPPERRKEIYFKGLAVAMAKLKDKQSSVDVLQAKSVSKEEYSQKYPETSFKAPNFRGTQPGTHGK